MKLNICKHVHIQTKPCCKIVAIAWLSHCDLMFTLATRRFLGCVCVPPPTGNLSLTVMASALLGEYECAYSIYTYVMLDAAVHHEHSKTHLQQQSDTVGSSTARHCRVPMRGTWGRADGSLGAPDCAVPRSVLKRGPWCFWKCHYVADSQSNLHLRRHNI